MKSAWADSDAQAAVARYARDGIARDLALRIYTTRLLGANPKLVLHGGGNTSVKTRMTDLNGEEVDVLCVKGSGWDMAAIEPAGLPAVRLEPLKKLRRRNALSDEDMVRLQRANLIDPSSPNPSVETLLHAFLPHKFVDHTHSTAVLSLTDQPAASETFVMRVDANCDATIARFAPVAWRLERGDVLLLAKNGDKLRFGRQEGGDWMKIPDTPRPLVMSRP